jgi:hypothetical protein
MRKLRICVAGVIGAVTLAGAGAALGATGGDPNAGDVWVDNVGQPAGPGHEMDPHLGCQDINLWGAGLADSSGAFTIDGWPPSGTKQQAYTGSWSYPGSGTQVIAVIDVQMLIAGAAANGDQPSSQGYHFKLEFSQDPQKHKTFWVNCPPPSASGTQGQTPGTTTTPGNSTGGQTSGKVVHRRHTRARKHHRLLKPKRHHRAQVRHTRERARTKAVFTG